MQVIAHNATMSILKNVDCCVSIACLTLTDERVNVSMEIKFPNGNKTQCIHVHREEVGLQGDK